MVEGRAVTITGWNVSCVKAMLADIILRRAIIDLEHFCRSSFARSCLLSICSECRSEEGNDSKSWRASAKLRTYAGTSGCGANWISEQDASDGRLLDFAR